MKQPKLSSLEIDVDGTLDIRSKMAKAKKVKITINLDEDLLFSVKKIAENSGTPYQRLINRLLRGAIQKSQNESSRIDRLEEEVEKLKKVVSG